MCDSIGEEERGMKKRVPCKEWAMKLALRQEDFSSSEWIMFETHLRKCSVCAAIRAEYGVIITGLQMLPPPLKFPNLRLPSYDDKWQMEGGLIGYDDNLMLNSTLDIIQAKRLLESQRYEEVLQAIEPAFRLHFNHREAWEIKAQALYKLGRYQEVINVCTHALEFDLNTVAIWKMKARSLLTLGRYREALRTCDHAAEADGGDAELWQIKAGVLFFLDREQEERDGGESLLQLDANYVVNSSSIEMWVDNVNMLCHEERWRYEKALEACDTALELDPKRKAVWEIKGRTLIALGMFENALEVLLYSLSLDPYDAEEWRFLGCVFNRLGRYENAQRAYKKAEEIDPNREEVWGIRTASLVC
jgi:tetratricopeptide (TPR) repeat protein